MAIVSPLLYAQFPNVMPKDVLQGLRRMGFNHTIDSSIFLEMYQCAAVEFIRRNRANPIAPWPLISPVCPAVVRLIAFRFPRLLAHVIPVTRPAALMAREIRKSLLPLYALQGRPVVAYYINPCPTMAETHAPAPGSPPYREVSLGVNDIYPELMRCIDAVLSDVEPFPKTDFEYETCANGSASLVAMSGGEIAGMRVEKSLAVPGLRETTEYLHKIEMGLFQEMEYFELRTCPEGCLGGVLNAVDKYLAKGNVHRMMHLYGLGRRVPRHTIQQMYDRGDFRPGPEPARADPPLRRPQARVVAGADGPDRTNPGARRRLRLRGLRVAGLRDLRGGRGARLCPPGRLPLDRQPAADGVLRPETAEGPLTPRRRP